MTLSALVADFLEYLELEKNASWLTIRNYDHYLKRFIEFAREIRPQDIDLQMVGKYRLFLANFRDPKTGKPLKKVTQNFFLIALRALLRYLAVNKIATLAPEKVELGDQEIRSLKILDDNQLQQILACPDRSKKDGIRDRAILETLFSTGLRVSELTSLNRDHISDGPKFELAGKGGRIRVIFLSGEAFDWINRFLAVRKDSFKPLFIRFQGRANIAEEGEAMRLTPRSIERIVEKYVKQAGLQIKATPQTLRYSFVADQLVNGVDIQTVQEMLGHSSISTTQIYAQLFNRHPSQ